MRGKNYYWGFFLILVAAVLLGNFFNLFYITHNLFTIIVTAMLIAFSLSNIPRLNFGGIIMPIVFVIIINQNTLSRYFNFTGSFWWLILGGAFLSAGLSVFFKKPRYKVRGDFYWDDRESNYDSNNNSRNHSDDYVDVEYTDSETPREENKEDDNRQSRAQYSETHSDETIQISASFTDRTRYVRSSNFTKGAIANSFGSLRVYFDQSTFNPNGSRLDVSCNFGQIVIYLPSNINVINNISATLGGLDDDFNRQTQNAPTLTISGDVAFGNVKIIYV